MNEIGSEIRVFPRRTAWTPNDDFTYYGEPPFWELPDLPVVVSTIFTWDKRRAEELGYAWAMRLRDVTVGGPAYDDRGDDFVPGRFIKAGVTITSRGCPKQCPYCLIPKREGKLREIPIRRGHIVQDNNLLACSRKHIESVFVMLEQEKKVVKFQGGLDIDYLEPWHVDWIKKLRIGQDSLWVACDRERDLARLDKARDLLSDFSTRDRRCYVLMGHDGDTVDAAESRCEKIFDNGEGFGPFAQFYQPATATQRIVPPEWKAVIRKWSRPAAYWSRR